MFKREVEFLVKLGVLEKQNESKWGAPYLSLPKTKTNRVQFLRDFINLNRKVQCNPYPMPKISEMLLKLERFTYDVSFGLNMRYYLFGSAKMQSTSM